MTHSLITQFCDAVKAWAQETKQPELGVIDYAMLDIGAAWNVKAVGGVENPDDPVHRTKTMGEIWGEYTLAQLYNYLHQLVDTLHIAEYVLVLGLVKSVEAHLIQLAVDFEEKRQQNLRSAEELEIAANDPDEFLHLEAFRQHLKERGEANTNEDISRHLRELAATIRKISANPDENEPERKYRVEVWQRLTASILEYKNIQKAIDYHLEIDRE